MSRTIQFGPKTVGEDRPVLIIAEIGVNHNGRVAQARRLIQAAKSAGADAVKFQMFRAASLSTREAPTAPYQRASTRLDSQMQMLRRLELSLDKMKKLKACAHKHRLVFFVSVFDELSLGDAEELDVPVIKLGSGELTNLPLIRRVARTGRTVVMSTGMSDFREVKRAVRVARTAGCSKLCLMHCVTAYPAEPKSLNLRKIPELSRKFKVPVGFSDHSTGNTAALGAVALGARMIEKHFTLARNLPGPDHMTSSEPEEFGELVRSVRDLEKALGSPHAGVGREELFMRQHVRKSIVSAVRLPCGAQLTRRMITFKRPGTGLSPDKLDEVLGRKLRVEVDADTILRKEMFVQRGKPSPPRKA